MGHKKKAIQEVKAAAGLLFEAWALAQAHGYSHADLMAILDRELLQAKEKLNQEIGQFLTMPDPDKAAAVAAANGALSPFHQRLVLAVFQHQKGR